MTRSKCAHIGLGVIIGAIALSRTPVRASVLPPGTVVVAHAAPTAVLIWDASPAVGDLVVAQQTGDAGMRALEADALAIMLARATTSRAVRMEVRVQYVATGVVGAAYNAATFADATPLLIVAAERTAIVAHANEWERDIASGRTPVALSVRVTGAFPQSR